MGDATDPLLLFGDAESPGVEPAPQTWDGLPARASWESGLPDVRDQYDDRSCGSWASAYYALSAIRAYREKKATPASRRHAGVQFLVRDKRVRGRNVFSPSFVFNWLKATRRWTVSAGSALAYLRDEGALTWYRHHISVDRPSPSLDPKRIEEARCNRVGNFGMIEVPTDPKWLHKVKWWLANRSPVIFDIRVRESFFEHKRNSCPITDITGPSLDTHVITCVGYDDSVDRGCLRFVNTWGRQWAHKGLAWVRYDAARALCGAGQRAWGLKL